MTVKRTIRTREQRLEDARKEIVKLEQDTKAQAIRLREQGEAWATRSEELKVKAIDIKNKANDLLITLGIDVDEFWAEYEAAATTAPEQG